jgi:hypothetical protein
MEFTTFSTNTHWTSFRKERASYAIWRQIAMTPRRQEQRTITGKQQLFFLSSLFTI